MLGENYYAIMLFPKLLLARKIVILGKNLFRLLNDSSSSKRYLNDRTWVLIFIINLNMVLESVSIFPHGTLILDIASATMSSQLPQHTVELHQASSSLASSLFSSNTTDYIFLITPHGIALKDRIGIYLNSSYAGSAEWNNCWSSYRVSCQNDVAVSKDILEYLQSHDLPIDSIACFSQGSVAPLAWAEVVPLWFCGFCSSELSNNSKTKIIIFSLPTIRLTDPLEFSKIAFRLGELLSDYAISSNHKIAIMISADLSHVHSIEGD
eukprot:gene17820-20608_t